MVLLFGGSNQGKDLSEYLFANGIKAVISVTSPIGKMILPEDTDDCKVIVGKMNYMNMVDFIEANNVDIVVDATMPYSQKASDNIFNAVEEVRQTNRNIKLIRLDEEREEELDYVTYYDSADEIMDYLNTKRGNIMVTAANTDLPAFKVVDNYEGRVYARMVNVNSIIMSLEKQGFLREHFCYDKGVFDVEQNVEMIRRYNIKYFVTKDTGRDGGLWAKAEACKRTHIKLIVLRRPKVTNGMSVNDAITEIMN